MLSLARLGPGAVEYLEDTVARGVEEYYLGVKEAPGQWLGHGAELLGLEGEVEGDAFRRVLSHADPSAGGRLTDGRSEPKVVGFDATFCAPKSVSLLYALGRGEVSNEVRNAHDVAVRAAMELYEQTAQGRRGKAGRGIVAGEGFVAAAYRHRTSRARGTASPHPCGDRQSGARGERRQVVGVGRPAGVLVGPCDRPPVQRSPAGGAHDPARCRLAAGTQRPGRRRRD